MRRSLFFNKVTGLWLQLHYKRDSGTGVFLWILRYFKNTFFTEQFCTIASLSFATGIFPEKLKVAKVIPTHIKDSKLECSSYRPIALLSNIDKILEKLMHTGLMEFLTEKKRFISNNLALGRILPDYKSYWYYQKQSITCGSFIDPKKAFGTVDHKILLKKLWHYGVRGITNGWFKSCLTNRMHTF